MHPDLGDASKGKLVTIVMGSTRHCPGERAGLFGSQRTFKTVEDFTEFEQRAA